MNLPERLQDLVSTDRLNPSQAGNVAYVQPQLNFTVEASNIDELARRVAETLAPSIEVELQRTLRDQWARGTLP